MKYWLLTSEYPPFYGGGIGTYCQYTSKMLAEKGYEVTVFVPDDSQNDYKISTDKNISVVRFNTNRNNLIKVLGYAARLSYAFADVVRSFIPLNGPPDVIEAQEYLGIAYYLQQFKLAGYEEFKNIPIIITLHSPAFLYLEYNRVATYKFPDFWTCEMEKQSIAAADYIITPTKYLLDELKSYIDFSAKKVSIIPNPFVTDPENNTGAIKRNKIFFYGKLSPQKGIFELLAYFKDIWDAGHKYELELIGGTDIVYHPEQQTMGQYIQSQYKGYINSGLLKIVGKIKPDAITLMLQDAHVVIVPSIVDNLPYVMMEVMSRGKVVLASVQGGQKEMVTHGVDGFLFDHKKKDDFKTKLFQILALQDEEIKKIGELAIEKIKSLYNFNSIYKQKSALVDVVTLTKEDQKKYPFLYQQPIVPFAEDNNELLTVVIPFYNMGAYILESVHSVLNSTYKPLQIIIVDDGSNDKKSLAVLDELKQEQKVTVFHKKNEGLAHTRNFGAEKAQGRYLAFLDADDKVGPQYFEKAIKVLAQKDNVFFVGAWVQYFENSSKIWPAFTPQPPYILVHNSVNSSGLVYKRKAFLQAGLNDKAVDYGLEDYESVVSMLHNGYNGVVLPEVLFYYRVRTGSMFRRVNINKLLYAYKYITTKHTAYYSKFAPQVTNLLNANGPGFLYDNPTFEVFVKTDVEKASNWRHKAKTIVKRNGTLKKIALYFLKKFK